MRGTGRAGMALVIALLAMTLSARTGLSYTSRPGRAVLLVTVLGSAIASIDATVVGIACRPSAAISAPA